MDECRWVCLLYSISTDRKGGGGDGGVSCSGDGQWDGENDGDSVTSAFNMAML